MRNLITVLFLLLSLPASADYLFMADGSIIECAIMKQKALSVTIRKSDGRTVSVSGYEILRIRQSKSWEKAEWIRTADGTLYHAHIVDDTGSGYVLRRKLTSPDEVTVAKEGSFLLKGETAAEDLSSAAEDSRIRLSWKGTGQFSVYLRKRGSDYHFESSAEGSHLLTGLAGSISCEAVLTSRNPDGSETVPSSSVRFISPDEPPLPPSHLSFRLVPGASGSWNLSVSWDGDSDSDGIVARYNIYLCDGAPVKIGTTVRKEFLVQGVIPSAVHYFSVTSVDDAGKESARSSVFASRPVSSWSYSIQPLAVFPLFGMREDLLYGYGARMTAVRNNCFVRGLGIGVSSGAVIFSGSGSVRRGDAVPLELVLSFSGTPVPKLDLSASLAGGSWYLSTLDTAKKRSSSFVPASELSLSCSLNLTKEFSFAIRAGYGLLYRSSSLCQYASVGGCSTFRFEW